MEIAMETAISVDTDEASRRLKKAIMERRWDSVIDAYTKDINTHTTKLKFRHGHTALHCAVAWAADDVVISLIDTIKDKTEDHLGEIVDEDGNTPLHVAAEFGSLKKCMDIAAAVPHWLHEENKKGESPLFGAARRRRDSSQVFRYLNSQYHADIDAYLRNDCNTVLHVAIENDNLELAYRILHYIPEDLAHCMNENDSTPFSALAEKTSAFRSSTRIPWWKAIIYYWIVLKKEMFFAQPEVTSSNLQKEKIPDNIPANYATEYEFFVMMKTIACQRQKNVPRQAEQPGDEEQIYALRRLCRTPPNYGTLMEFLSMSSKILWSTICKLSGLVEVVEDLRRMKANHIWSQLIIRKLLTKQPDDEVYRSSILIAARNGVEEVLNEILKDDPDYVWATNEEGKNVLHLAVENMQPRIVQMLTRDENFDMLLDSDKHGNTALHLAATTVGRPSEHRRSAYSHLKSQAEWFKYIEKRVPSEFKNQRNFKEQKPYDILREEQTKLLDYSVQFPTNASSVVASVIAAAAFSTTSEALGRNKSEGKIGNNANSKEGGHPSSLLLGMSSLVGLVFSIGSLMIYLDIISSKWDVRDVMELPKKNVQGRFALTISIAAMMIYFLAANYNLTKDSFTNHHLLKTIYAAAFLSLISGVLIDNPLRRRITPPLQQSSVDRLIKWLEKHATSTGEFAAS